MNLEYINLISFGYFEKGLLELVANDVKKEFLLPVIYREGHLDLSEFYDPGRRQYDGNKLLKTIDSKFAFDNDKTLGLFNVDLYIPISNHCFYEFM